MSLHIQNFLRLHGADHQKAFANLKNEFGIDAKVSVRHPSLVLFKYDQIESPMGKPIVQECRGIILDSADDWNVVAYPFNKFFNYGEGHAASIDWKTARVQEKIDGSLMTLYWYGNEWNVASSGNPDAAGEVNGYPFTFRELFWKTWGEMALTLDTCEEFYTYMFELTSPYNRVVVPHIETKLTLIGVRSLLSYNDNGYHEDRVDLYDGFFPVVKEFPLTSFDGIMSSFDHIDGVHQEGYVVVDGNFNRVKVKHPQYVALHHMKDAMGGGMKSLVRIVQANEGSEFLTYFPEFTDDYNKVVADFHKLTDGLDLQYEIIFDDANGNSGKVNRKAFAMNATKTRIPGYMFARLDGKVSNVRDYLKDIPIDGLMRMLGYKEAK